MTNWCTRNKKCFTGNFRSHYQRTRKELFPVLSRIQNIGYELGENQRTAEWYRANHRTPWVASSERHLRSPSNCLVSYEALATNSEFAREFLIVV